MMGYTGASHDVSDPLWRKTHSDGRLCVDSNKDAIVLPGVKIGREELLLVQVQLSVKMFADYSI
jgi:hypothetical protein